MLIPLILALLSPNASAFIDPFTVIAAAQAVSGAVGAVSSATETVSAMDEFFAEVNSTDAAMKESDRIQEEVRRIESLLREADSIGMETEDAVSGIESAKNLTETIRGITSAIRTTKRILRGFGSLEKRSQNAQIESSQYEREQLVLQYEQYNLQKLHELREARKELEAELNKRRLSQAMEDDLKSKGARMLGAKGLLRFPNTNEVVEDGLGVAEKLRPYLLSLVIAILLMRLIYYQFSFEPADRYWDLLRDVFICFMMLACYPEVIRASHKLSQSIAESILMGEHQATYKSIWSSIEKASIEKFKLSIFLTAEMVWQGIRWLGYITAAFCFKYLILIMVVITPIVIFMSEMFNFPLGWKVFFMGFVCLNLWPVLWNVFGKLVDVAASHELSAVSLVETAIAMILQLSSPIILYALAKAGAGGGLSVAESVSTPAKKLAMNAIMPGSGSAGGGKKLAGKKA